ncbi:MAG: hypothetical protein JOZ23_01335 [Mycobacterium sp.]|nr:hypothetical protein [Mycobacterium sp.]
MSRSRLRTMCALFLAVLFLSLVSYSIVLPHAPGAETINQLLGIWQFLKLFG